jgi:dolichyl-phosphate-mannose--protein O-mannosyl transferase
VPSSALEPLLPEPRPSLYDRLTERLAGDPRSIRVWRWLAPTLVTLLAGILRFWNLGHPHALVFDETYYVKDAWTQWILGFPSQWPDRADEQFVLGATDIFETTGSFVVHPPLGKWLIGAGIALFGADSSVGWRVATALFGTALVLLVYVVAHTMTNSIVFSAIAGGLMAVDGLAIVTSRVAILDVFVAFFVLLAFWFVLLDRRGHLARMALLVALRTRDGRAPAWGPVLWNRPWIIAAGAAAGAATAVKWSGLYVIAGLGVYLVLADAVARRRAGVGFWPTDAAFRQGPVTFLLFVPVAFAVYLASWTGWLATDGGYDRNAIEAANAAIGFWSWVPLPLQNLWAYHQAMYGFHVGLTTPHSYASPAWQWPLLVRPTSMYYHSDVLGQAGCTATNGCVQNIYSLPNPLIWWAGIAAVIYLVWRFIRARDWRYGAVLTGVAVTYLPWLLYPERTIFEFYTIAMLPFMVLALTFALRDIAGSGATGTDHRVRMRRKSGQRVVIVFLVFAVLLSAFWYPILTATPVPYDFWRLHNWLQSWV